LPARPAGAARPPSDHSADWTALAESRAALHEQRDYLARLATTLEGRDRELQSREAELQTRWDELEARRTERQDWEREIQCQQEELSRARSDLAQQRQQLASQQDGVDTQRDELERRRAAFDERQMELDRRDEALRDASERLHSGQSELDSQRRQLETEQARLQAQADALAARESELTSQQSQLDSTRAALAREQAELAQQQADWRLESEQIAAARAALDDSRREFQAECQRIDAARAELVQLRNDLEVSRADSGLVRREMETEREQLEASRHDIAAERAALEARIRDWEAQQADHRQRTLDTEQLDAERKRLDEQQSMLEQRRTSLEAERQALGALRADIDADRDELQAARDRWEAQQAAWTADASQLDAERSRLAQEREQLQALREQLAARQPGQGDIGHPPHMDAAAFPVALLSADRLVNEPEEPVAPEETPAAFVEPFPVAEFGADEDALAPCDDPLIEHHDVVDSAVNWGAETPRSVEPSPETDQFVGRDEVSSLAPAAFDDQQPTAWGDPPPALSDVAGELPPAADVPDDSGVAPAVKALRSQLAELFGISSQTAFGHSRLEPDEPEDDLAPPELAEDAADDEPVVMDETQPPLAGEAAPLEKEPLAKDDARSHTTADSGGVLSPAPSESSGDSISDYMERLLARSRTATTRPEPPTPESARRRRPAAETEETASAAPPVPPPPPLEMPTAPPKSIAPEERVALRANIDSFRELANASARSAVAKHESKKLRTMVQIKVALAIIAGGLTVLLFIANSVGRVSYGVYTLAAAFATVVMVFDLARTVLAFYRWKSVESAATWDGESELSSENLRTDMAGDGAADDNSTSDLPLAPATDTADAPVSDELEETSPS
jgi:peptidoglycan hydrolase CwlO-like protein